MTNLFEKYNKDELLITDIQFLGLKQKAWDFTRGMRTKREYLYENDILAVCDQYSYVMSNGDRDVETYSRKITWHDENGTMVFEKDITPELNIKNIKTINRAIRQGRIDYMIAAAEQLMILSSTVPEPFSSDFVRGSNSIGVILNQYDAAINNYISTGDMGFENKVRHEENPIMLEILNLIVRPPDQYFEQGLTIKQSILHQLTGEYNP